MARQKKTIQEDEQFSLDLTGAVDTTGCGQGLSLKQHEYFQVLESQRGMVLGLGTRDVPHRCSCIYKG
ncbi:MAG TPA: hypothetical protein VE201_04170, partial [Nitrospirales bacterium]|nr:hypothetical protein [Nitrospirales bacterium]